MKLVQNSGIIFLLSSVLALSGCGTKENNSSKTQTTVDKIDGKSLGFVIVGLNDENKIIYKLLECDSQSALENSKVNKGAFNPYKCRNVLDLEKNEKVVLNDEIVEKTNLVKEFIQKKGVREGGVMAATMVGSSIIGALAGGGCVLATGGIGTPACYLLYVGMQGVGAGLGVAYSIISDNIAAIDSVNGHMTFSELDNPTKVSQVDSESYQTIKNFMIALFNDTETTSKLQ